jgi:hypothetical protein
MNTGAVLASALGCCTWACVNLHPASVRAAPPRAEVYQRATNQFAQADFFKPAESKTNDLAFTLAPLILQEVTGAKTPLTPLDRFGTLSLSNGLLVLDQSRPAIYWQADTVALNGKTHTRLAYLWFYSPGPGASDRERGVKTISPDRAETGLPMQGIRITLNSTGQPVVWEVLADTSGRELIFVSHNLEAAAAAQFGKALPGRRYATERSQAEAPNVIVARVIDDGPAAMGPIVYLSAGTWSVSTLVCRCMPAAVKTLQSTTTYVLLPLQAMPMRSFFPQPTASEIARPAFWPGDAPTSNRLEKCLRLPPF